MTHPGLTSESTEAFSRAARTYQQRVFDFIARRVQNMNQAAELANTAIQNAWQEYRAGAESSRARQTAQPRDPLSLVAFLAPAYRLTCGQHGQRAQQAANPAQLKTELQARPSRNGTASTPPAALALARVNPENRELLQMSLWDDLTTVEIAQLTGEQPDAIAAQLAAARTAFERELSSLSEGGEQA